MTINDLFRSAGKLKRKISEMDSGYKSAESLGAAMAVGIVAGIILGFKFGNRMQNEVKKAAGTILTIEVNDLEKIKIERIE